ncbi:MAG: hypothetical protein PHO37_10380, partial [Kiritimatiellae bacterium]|nr:hypothetical protein [Kiritimatiellia bacterium]
GTAYTYLSDGRIATRKWARNIITTYGYADTATGSIRTTDYNDTTPSVTNYYNLIGQLMKVEDGTGTTTFGYDLRGRLIAETNTFAVITRSYDTYGRYAIFILNPVNPVYPVQKIVFGYDTLNRLNSITSIVGTEINTFTYSYLLGTQIISGYTVTNPEAGTTNLIVTRTYEPNRDLISTVTNSFVALVPSVVSSFSYYNDSTGKRTGRIDYYNGSTVTNTFDYNIRDEVTNAVMNSDEHSIIYDYIGNRQTSTVNSVPSAYTANQLNQYTSVNSGGFARSITHDLDGNLTWDGQKWDHSWDGENRLISSDPDYWGTTNGACMFEYRYNHQNLRVEKIKKQLSGRDPGYPMTPGTNPGTWNPIETRRYIWDGWNIAAEIIIDHVTPATNISYYTWGLDLSGTLQGAGGVGGLLSDTKVASSGSNTYFVVGDANGNITEYVNDTGATVAHGEHNAFGETKLSGSMKDQFTHWFSSKPFDPRTGLVQYELRPYLPLHGVFLLRDTVGTKGGLKLHGILNNNSLNKWDFLGRAMSNDENIDFSNMIKWRYEVEYRWGALFSLNFKSANQALPGEAPYRRKLNAYSSNKDWCLWKSRKLVVWSEPAGGFSKIVQNEGYSLRFEPFIAFTLDGKSTEGKWKPTWSKPGELNWSGFFATTGSRKTFEQYIWLENTEKLDLYIHRKIIKHNVMNIGKDEQILTTLKFKLEQKIGGSL